VTFRPEPCPALCADVLPPSTSRCGRQPALGKPEGANDRAARAGERGRSTLSGWTKALGRCACRRAAINGDRIAIHAAART